MSEVEDRYQKILREIQDNIKDEQELNFINSKLAEVADLFSDTIDIISNNFEMRLHELEAQQVLVESKLRNIHLLVKNIESDIYEENTFDLICPHCFTELTITVQECDEPEIICSECNNVIELDYNDKCINCECSCNYEENSNCFNYTSDCPNYDEEI